MSTFRGLLADFSGPSALDLLTEFRKKFVALAELRTAELRAEIDTFHSIGPTAEMRAVYDEYDSLRYFEQELNRVISAFVNEAIKPWMDVYASTTRFDMIPSFDKTILGKPTGKCSKCGGSLFGSASHYCPTPSTVIRCHRCKGTIVYKRTPEGFEIFHGCESLEQSERLRAPEGNA